MRLHYKASRCSVRACHPVCACDGVHARHWLTFFVRIYHTLADSIVVLFRNNHFATVFKRQVDSRANDKPASASGTNKPDFIDRMSDLLLGSDAEVLPNSGHRFVGEYELLLLATDQGYAEKRELVWETLANHDGDSVFLTGNYDEYRPQQNSPLYERVERRRSSQQPDTTAPDLKLPAATANNAIKSRLLPTSAVDATTSDSQTAALLTQLANEDRAARQQLTNSTPSSAEHRIRQPTTQASDAQAASTQETRDRQLAVQLQDAEYLAMQQQGAQSQSSRWRVGAEKCTVM